MVTAAAAAALYAEWFIMTGIGLPCPIYRLTGLKCPGCGITHMLSALMRGRFHEAFVANPFLLATSPLLFWLIFREMKPPRTLRGNRVRRGLLCGYIAGLVIFGILRNMQAFSQRDFRFRPDLTYSVFSGICRHFRSVISGSGRT